MSLSSPSLRRTPPIIGLVLFVVVAMAVLCLAFLSRFNGFTVHDDAYSYLRYADHILAGHGMVWNVDGGAVYGVSSLAYVFAVIPFRLLFPDNPAAAMFSASFFWGLAMMVLLFRLAMRVMAPSPAQKPYLMGLVMLALVATAGSLRIHFASGMETTFVMAYVALVISFLEQLRQGKGNAWLAGAVLGLGWLIRPDLLVLTLGVPLLMAMLGGQGTMRGVWLRVLLLSLAGTGLCLLGANVLAGSYLPTGSTVRDSDLYGSAYLDKLRWKPIGEAARFIANNWPPMILIGMGVYLKWSRLRTAYHKLDIALGIVAVVALVYWSFCVLQTMGYGQRYYYPLLPVLVYMAARELMDLQESLRLGPGVAFKGMPPRLERIGVVFLAGMMLYYGIDHGRALKQARVGERFAVFATDRVYHEELQAYWVHLDALEGLPATLRIASTEVGIPSALLPGRTIDDLSGIHSPAVAHDGLTAASVLQHCPADLIYLPLAQYAHLAKSLDSSAAFTQAYTIHTAEQLQASMGVAIRNDGPFAAQLHALFAH